MKTASLWFTTFLSVLSLAVPSLAQTPDNLLSNPGFENGTADWRVPNSDKGRASIVDAQVGPYKKALRVDVKPAPDDKQWAVILRQVVNAPLKKGEPLTLRAWVRSPDIAKSYAFLEPMTEPYVKSLEKTFDLTPAWQEISVSGTAREDYAAGGTSAGLQLAFGTGTVEMTGLRLIRGAVTDQAAPLVPLTNVAPLPSAPTVVGASLLQNGDFTAPLEGNWYGGGKLVPQMEVVPTQVGGFSKALRVSVAPPADSRPWDSRLAQRVNVPIKKGDTVYMRVWMRSPESAPVGLFLQQVADPYTKSAERSFTLTPEWKEYKFTGVAKQDFAPGESLFEFHVGQTKATIELAGVRVENYGSTPPAGLDVTPIDYWGGQKHDDAWKKAAFERIEKHRKGDLKIRVVDAKGKPIPGATVKLDQTRHGFRWGSAVLEGRVIDTENPDHVRYRAEIERLYNTVVFEGSMKWGIWKTPDAEAEEAKRAKVLPQVEEAIRQLRAKGFEVRGHALVWGRPDHLPHKVLNLENDALRLAVKDHIFDYVNRFEDKVYVWDVVNEAVTNHWLWDKIGWEEFANAYKWAREADPDLKLAYNDYNITNEAKGSWHREEAKRKIQYLIDQGAPLDIIGDQAHMDVPLTPLPRVLEILDEMAKFGKPIEITEFDVGVADDKIHGEYVRDFLIAAFSHPKVEAFLMWGFWEGAHWRGAEGAMFRKDWSKRPAQEAYEKLVLNDWMTDVTLRADKDGVIQTRGFLGDYDVTVSANGKSKTFQMKLPKDGARMQVVLAPR